MESPVNIYAVTREPEGLSFIKRVWASRSIREMTRQFLIAHPWYIGVRLVGIPLVWRAGDVLAEDRTARFPLEPVDPFERISPRPVAPTPHPDLVTGGWRPVADGDEDPFAR